jgi:hypothetical protein
MESELKTKITTLRSRAVKIILPDGTTIIVRRPRKGKSDRKTTVKTKSYSECTVIPIDE